VAKQETGGVLKAGRGVRHFRPVRVSVKNGEEARERHCDCDRHMEAKRDGHPEGHD
jgi:hypothetical protein